MTQKQSGCTLQQYSDAKKVKVDFLRTLSVRDTIHNGKPAIQIPYHDTQGNVTATRYRIALTGKGKDKFRWEKDSTTALYVNPALINSCTDILLVEGESDCHTLWSYSISAYGLPGAANWREEYAAQFDRYNTVYIVIEQDTGGKAVMKWLKESQIRHKARLVNLGVFKDISEMHCDDPKQFTQRFQQALDSSIPWEEQQEEDAPSLLDTLMESAKKLTKGEHEAASALLEEAAELPALQQRLLFGVIKDRTGFNLSDLKKTMTEIHGSGGEDHLMLARQVVDDIGRENLLSTIAHVWLWHCTGVWRAVDDRRVKQLIQNTLEQKGNEVMRSLVDGVADVLKTDIFAEEHEWNPHSDAISFLNGELHWTGTVWELQPHCREHYRTTQIPHHYKPNALCPRFEKFLNEILVNDIDMKEKRLLILELIGYTLLSNARLEVFVLLIGGGANGKSVLLDVIRMLVGTASVAAVQPSQFASRFQRAHLHGKLANLVTEIAEGAEIADAELKAIVSGELTTAEQKNKNPFNFRPFCTCWFGTNHMPHTRDFSDALFRRAKVITFNRKFKYQTDADPNPEDKADPHLKDKLAEEMEGIIALTLHAFGEVLKRGTFTEPESCAQAKQEWRIEADQVAQFVGEMCKLELDAEITSSLLYVAYKDWANDAGVTRKLNRKNFTSRIMRLGGKPCKGTGGKRMIAGIRVKSAYEQE